MQSTVLVRLTIRTDTGLTITRTLDVTPDILSGLEGMTTSEMLVALSTQLRSGIGDDAE